MAATKATAKSRQTTEARNFRKNIRTGIKRLEVTQGAAGAKVGFKPAQIPQILHALSNPNVATMVRMAAMVEIPLHLLLGPALPVDSDVPVFVAMTPADWSQQPEEGARFLENVRNRIKRLGLTGEEAGKTVGYAPGQMSQLLKRTTNPTIYTMVRMAKMTDKTVAELLDPAFDPWGPVATDG